MSQIANAFELLEKVKKVSSWLKVEKHDSMRIDCMNYLGTYSSISYNEKVFSRWVGQIKGEKLVLPKSLVYEVQLSSMKPIPLVPIKGAVFEDADNYYVNMAAGLNHEMIKLEISYRMEQEWIDKLVYARSSPEPLGDSTRYELTALLTEPKGLVKGFDRIDVRDYPVTAEIRIQENFDMDSPVMRKLEEMHRLDARILADYNPRGATDIMGLQKRRFKVKKQLENEDVSDVLMKISKMLQPTKFLKYIRMQENLDFKLHQCKWGDAERFGNIGNVPIPKVIEVATRTDLSLEQPSAKGYMYYECDKFRKDIDEMLGNNGHKKKHDDLPS